MTSVYPSIRQMTPQNLEFWMEKYGPLQKLTILNEDSQGQPFELELVFGHEEDTQE